MEPRVLERHDRLTGERRRRLALLGVELVADEKQATEAPRPAFSSKSKRAPPAPTSPVSTNEPSSAMTTPPSARVASTADSTISGGAARLERRRERVPEARVRLAQPPALLLQLVHPRLELSGHLVEGPAELRELVAALDRHALAQPTGRDASWAASARRPSEPTIERPATYATTAIKSSDPTSPTSSRPIRLRFSDAIPDAGVSAASCTPLAGTSRAPSDRKL